MVSQYWIYREVLRHVIAAAAWREMSHDE